MCASKMHVGNLADTVDASTLQRVFEGFNVVDCVVVVDKETNLPKGFGFVEFKSAADATRALNELNEQAFQPHK